MNINESNESQSNHITSSDPRSEFEGGSFIIRVRPSFDRHFSPTPRLSGGDVENHNVKMGRGVELLMPKTGTKGVTTQVQPPLIPSFHPLVSSRRTDHGNTRP